MENFVLRKSNEPIPSRPLFLVVYGNPGTGKTTLSFTAPGPVLHVDFDKGLDRAYQGQRPDSFSVSQYGPFHEFVMSNKFTDLIADEGYKSIVIDTVGTLLDDYMTSYLIKKNPKLGNSTGGLTLQGWGALSSLFNELKARLQSLGIHIVAICHAKEEDENRVKLAVRGGSTDILHRTADMIGYQYNRGAERVIDFRATGDHIGKTVLDSPEEYYEIPSAVKEPEAYQDFLSDLVDQAQKKMTSLSEAQKQFQAAFNANLEMLKDCKTPEDFTNFIQSLAEEESKTMQARLKKHLTAALKDKNFKYDPKQKKVVAVSEEKQPEKEAEEPENGTEEAEKEKPGTAKKSKTSAASQKQGKSKTSAKTKAKQPEEKEKPVQGKSEGEDNNIENAKNVLLDS